MPPWWAELSINEVLLAGGPVGIELQSRAADSLVLDGVYLSDDRADLLKWMIPRRTLAAGEIAYTPLPGTLLDADWLALAASDGPQVTIIDSVMIGDPMAGPALGRHPDGFGRMRVLAEATPGSANIWSSPILLEAETDRLTVPRGEAVELELRVENEWRSDIDLRLLVELEGENGTLLELPPIYDSRHEGLGPGDRSARNHSTAASRGVEQRRSASTASATTTMTTTIVRPWSTSAPRTCSRNTLAAKPSSAKRSARARVETIMKRTRSRSKKPAVRLTCLKGTKGKSPPTATASASWRW